MKGLSIKINDAIYNIGMRNGIVDFMITNKDGEYHVHAAGMDENALSYIWYSGELLHEYHKLKAELLAAGYEI